MNLATRFRLCGKSRGSSGARRFRHLAKDGDRSKAGARLRVLVVRHAIAEEREAFAKRSRGAPDGERPLTREGRRKFEAGAKGLHALVPKLDALATSPLTRAVETAEI